MARHPMREVIVSGSYDGQDQVGPSRHNYTLMMTKLQTFQNDIDGWLIVQCVMKSRPDDGTLLLTVTKDKVIKPWISDKREKLSSKDYFLFSL